MLYEVFTQVAGITTPAKVLMITAVWNPGTRQVRYDVLDLASDSIKEVDEPLFRAYLKTKVLRPLSLRDQLSRPLINYELLDKIEHIQAYGYHPQPKPLDKAA